MPLNITVCKRDVFFVVDESDSMQSSQSTVLNFVKSVVSNFDIGQDKTLVALGTFASDYYTRFDLDDHLTLYYVTRAIDQVLDIFSVSYNGFELNCSM